MSFVQKELRRLLDRLQVVDVSDDEYIALLRNTEIVAHADWLDDAYAMAYGNEEVADSPEVPTPPVVIPIAEVLSPHREPDPPATVREPYVEEPPFDTASDTVSQVAEEEAAGDDGEHPAFTPAEVRTALVEARRNGANVTDILKEFGVESFPAFPESRYWELMERVKRVKA